MAILKDHPRLRGKDVSTLAGMFGRWGSPPLTRERQIAKLKGKRLAGITPAYAGKTKFFYRPICRVQDHPRLRGKDEAMERRCKKKEGSPPLTRERHKELESEGQLFRITPAYAGKTFGDNGLKLKNKDHPRLRGKDRNCHNCPRMLKGSPPLTRERRKLSTSWLLMQGITPAYAGKTVLSKMSGLHG